jgi:hypothetical protein
MTNAELCELIGIEKTMSFEAFMRDKSHEFDYPRLDTYGPWLEPMIRWLADNGGVTIERDNLFYVVRGREIGAFDESLPKAICLAIEMLLVERETEIAKLTEEIERLRSSLALPKTVRVLALAATST